MPSPSIPTPPAPLFHEGEVAVQTQAGRQDKIAKIGRIAIHDEMPGQHREFFTQLPFLVVGSIDQSLQPWASIIAGPPGFICSPNPQQLVIHAKPLPQDPLSAGLQAGTHIVLLGIEPHTRRRNRVNGWIETVSQEGFTVQVQQSFGNCPKYIQPRKATWAACNNAASRPAICSNQLNDQSRKIIQGADTFFIASAHPASATSRQRSQGVDVSHRGGKPGFIQINNGTTLTVPDYIGNFFFNTLGNLALNPKAGLLFIDFATRDLLYLAVEVVIIWDKDIVQRFEGAHRLLRMCVKHVNHVPACLAINFQSI